MNALVFPFRDDAGLPGPGQTMEVAPGVHWLRMPLPYRLDHINLWLIEDGEGWVLVDTCIQSNKGKAIWRGLFEAKRIGRGHGRPVTRLVCTHFHPDHMGLAGWLAAELETELWTSRAEWLFARMLWLDAEGEGQRDIARHYAHHGLDAARVAEIAQRGNTYRMVVGEPPRAFNRLRHADTIAIGGRAWQVIVGLGHAPEQTCLYCADLGVLIAGDQILPRITPNIGVWATEPSADPLADYLQSLDRFRPLPEETLVLPSHGYPFTGLHLRLDQLAGHHEERLDALAAALDRHPKSGATKATRGKTAVELIPVLFRQVLDNFQIGFAIGETLAHLACLEGRGRARRSEADGVVRFSAS
ncbi:MAG TPA: MBL fold metallo-hydrolase [Alphaproteobacteria bacterium]|jgi:glyoxylase-like metal-dependent hydrolase (beta-lactamase superfamily II)